MLFVVMDMHVLEVWHTERRLRVIRAEEEVGLLIVGRGGRARRRRRSRVSLGSLGRRVLVCLGVLLLLLLILWLLRGRLPCRWTVGCCDHVERSSHSIRAMARWRWANDRSVVVRRGVVISTGMMRRRGNRQCGGLLAAGGNREWTWSLPEQSRGARAARPQK